jgi:hypothetical protein
VEGAVCGGGVLKRENGGQMTSSPLHGGAAGDAGKELLRHLLKDKASAAAQAPPTCRQLSNDSLRSEEEEGPAGPGSHNSLVRGADSRTLGPNPISTPYPLPLPPPPYPYPFKTRGRGKGKGRGVEMGLGQSVIANLSLYIYVFHPVYQAVCTVVCVFWERAPR